MMASRPRRSWIRARELADPRIIAVAAAIAAGAAGVVWGTYVAGGSDSYCYLSQAELLSAGHVAHPEPLAAAAPWPDAIEAFVPAGYVAGPGGSASAVPMCPPGYPLLMALARRIAGRSGMFATVPLLGALAVWLTFVLGRRLGDSYAGAVAATLLAASPPFLYQIVQPMSDVPATAFWALALVAVTDRQFGSSGLGALRGGLATGMALLVRPNLLPLVGVAALAAFITQPMPWRRLLRTWAIFAGGALPFALAIALLQNAMFGSPLKSGYGDFSFIFRLDRVWPNLQRYPVWLVQTETPIVLAAFAAPWFAPAGPARRARLWALAFAAAVFACYLPYIVFDAWWYLRFVLPAYPPLLALTAAVVVALLSRVSFVYRAVGFAAVGVLAIFMVRTAIDRKAFELWKYERRFRLAGEYVAARLPQNAAVVTSNESGSVRFYSGRPTLIWRDLPEGSVDRALDFLRAQGYRPYLLFETAEQSEFVRQSGSATRLGGLGWPPVADINHEVRIYDPDDYDRYRAGVPVRTDRVWILRRGRRLEVLRR